MKQLSNFRARLLILFTPLRKLFKPKNWGRKDLFRGLYLIPLVLLLSCKTPEPIVIEKIVNRTQLKDSIVYKTVDNFVYRDSVVYRDSINKVWITRTVWRTKTDTIIKIDKQLVRDTVKIQNTKTIKESNSGPLSTILMILFVIGLILILIGLKWSR